MDEAKQETMDGSAALIQEKYISIKLQLGPVKEAGVNGTQIDRVLELLIRRLEEFQDGPFKCRENALAITKIQEALHWLEHRTKSRVRREVEGKNIL